MNHGLDPLTKFWRKSRPVMKSLDLVFSSYVNKDMVCFDRHSISVSGSF